MTARFAYQYTIPIEKKGYERYGFNPWVRKIHGRRKQQLTPVFSLEKSHGQRSLADYSLKGHKL